MHARFFAVLTATLSAAACAGTISAPRDVSPGQSVELSVGESAAVMPGSVRVQFVGVSDSRCPSDVVCVTAGDATITLNFTGAGPERIDTVYLVRQPRAVVYGGYRFEAADVKPYPLSTGQRPAQTLVLRVLQP